MDKALLVKLERLVAAQEILECLTRYCRGMDRLDEALVRSAFHPDAVDVHHSVACSVDDFLAWVFPYHAKQKFHQHCIFNHSVEIGGDVAHSEVYYQFLGTYPDHSTRVTCAGGRYLDRMERRGGEWRIASRYCTSEYYLELDMPAVIVQPIDCKALLEEFAVTRDRGDLSYVRPLTATIAAATA
jgi:hypothetical protein